MSTSGSTDWSANRDDIIQQILENCKVVSVGVTPPTAKVTDAGKVLNRIVKRFQAEGLRLWTLDWKTKGLSASSKVTGSDGNIYACVKTHLPAYENKPINGVKYTDNWILSTWTSADTLSNTLDAAAAVDGGGGTVDITITAHGLTIADIISISGTTNYDGSYSITAVDDADTITITATYAAETFSGIETVITTGRTWSASSSKALNAAAAVDGGDGTVDIAITAHGFTASDRVQISGTTNYDGEYAITAVDNANTISITVPYVAETFTTAMTAKSVYTSIGDFAVASDTLGIDTAFIRRNGTDHQVTIVGSNEYLRISRKETEGLTNCLWFNEREQRVYLSNHPSETSDVLHYLRVEALEDFDTGTDTPDFPVRWIDLLVAEGTYVLSSKYDLPLQERSWFRVRAAELKKENKADDQEKTEDNFIKPI